MKLTNQCIIFLVTLSVLQILLLVLFSGMLADVEGQMADSRYSATTANSAVALFRGIQEWALSFFLGATMSNRQYLANFSALSNELSQEFQRVLDQTREHADDHQEVSEAKEAFDFMLAEVNRNRKEFLEHRDMLGLMDVLRMKVRALANRGSLSDIGEPLHRVIGRNETRAQRLVKLEQKKQAWSKLTLVGVSLANIVSMSLLALGFSKGVTRRLAVINDNFNRFKASRALNSPQTGKDEICELDASFRSLAEDLAEASQKDKAIFTNMPIGLISCNGEGMIESINPYAEQMFRKSSAELQAMPVKELLDPTRHHVAIQSKVLEPGKYYFLSADLISLPVELTVSSYTIGKAERYLFALADLTAREQVETMKQEFMSMVSHDLQTPLTSIKACLTLLREKSTLGNGEDVGKFIVMAESESERLIRLTTDLLVLAKGDSGRIVLNKEVVSSVSITEHVVGAVAALAEKKTIKLIDDKTEHLIYVDPDKVCQILANFLSNAIKCSEPNTEIKVCTEVLGDAMKFSVIDQGRGIPPDQVGEIFDRFKQVYREDADRGTGLGLAICKLIAEAHGGQVGVDSVLGTGSTFWVLLPGCIRGEAEQEC